MEYENGEQTNNPVAAAAPTTSRISRKKPRVWSSIACSKSFNPPELNDPRYECVVKYTPTYTYVRYRERAKDETTPATASSASASASESESAPAPVSVSTPSEEATDCAPVIERNDTANPSDYCDDGTPSHVLQFRQECSAKTQSFPQKSEQLQQQQQQQQHPNPNQKGYNGDDDNRCIDSDSCEEDSCEEDSLDSYGNNVERKLSPDEREFRTLLDAQKFDTMMKYSLAMMIWVSRMQLTPIDINFLYKLTMRYISSDAEAFDLFQESLNTLCQLNCSYKFWWKEGDISVVDLTELGMCGKNFHEIYHHLPGIEPYSNYCVQKQVKDVLILESTGVRPEGRFIQETESRCPAKDMYEILLDGQPHSITELVSSLFSKGYNHEEGEHIIRRGINVLLNTNIARKEPGGYISVNPEQQCPYFVYDDIDDNGADDGEDKVGQFCSICSDPIGGARSIGYGTVIKNSCCNRMFHRGCVSYNCPPRFSGTWCPACHAPIVVD